MKTLKKSRTRAASPSHRRQLEQLLKQILAGKTSLHRATPANAAASLPYRRWIE